MTTKYFKATLEAVSPSYSKGKKLIVFGTAFENQTMEGQASHIGLIKGLGTNKVVSLKEYNTGEEWYEAQYGKGSMTTQQQLPRRKKQLSTVQTGEF